MYIESVTIHGFTSFRDTVTLSSLSPGRNVVVGRNGSGKSNFFAAIRFVLGDAYTSLSREEREALLYDGSGATSTTLSAYVELVFDNRDKRFPLSGATVTLRRTISASRDEYTVDGKAATKQDVANLLESAGFSLAHPYYIVPQGRLAHLTHATDAERLELLKDVAGTRAYEQRRAESVALLRSTEARYTSAAELLAQLDRRIAELSAEQTELATFYERDRQRRSLEYTIYQRELADVADQLEAALERDVADTQQQLEQLGLEHAQLEAERRELARAQAQLETSIDDWDAPRGSSTPELQAQLDALDAQVAEREAALATQLASYAADAQALERERAAYEAQRTRIAALYAKQGRSAHFASEEARDAALRAELAELEQEDAALAAAARDTAAALDAARTQHAEHVRAREDHEQRTAAAAAATHDAHEAWRALQARREALLEQKKSAWRKETHCTAQLTHARDQLSAAQRLLAGTMDRATAAGLQSVEAIVARERLTGVHGPLYQLFDVDERYATAVEATAGAALFHVVVDTDDTAAQLLRHLHDQKTGRVTFMPLNRLRPADTQYPQAPDAVVMLRKLQFADALLPAFKQVFGKTIICPRLDIAAAYVRSHAGLNAITLDGDQVDRRGALSGGFVDPGRSRLDAIKAVRRWLAELDAAETQLRELRAHTTQLEQDATALHTDMLAKEAARTKEQDARALAADELTWLRRSEADAAARVARLERLAADRAVEAAALATRRDALAAEIGTPLDARLAPDEATELRALVAAEGDAAARIAEHGRAVVAQAEALERLRSELDEHLRRTRDALVQRLERRATQPSDQAAAALATHVDANKARLTQLQAQQDALGARLTQLYAQQAAAVAGDDVDSDAQRQHARTERFAARHQRLLEQRTRCNERIRDLGIVPDDAFQAHQKHSTEQLAHELSAVRAALAQVAHVNKRAVEQLDSFSQQRNSLRQRHDDLKASHAAILELVDVLDARKDEALRTTGAQVAAHFQRLFQRLVPHGRAELQLSERGAALRVAFHRQRASMPIAQLSGGQKALVALALVLAMQACDPAPFYLFDEIDANLDTQHRTAVANLLSSIDGAQLIATTFRPELVERADRHYGVVFSAQKVSTIVDISMADAHDFVEAADST